MLASGALGRDRVQYADVGGGVQVDLAAGKTTPTTADGLHALLALLLVAACALPAIVAWA